MGEWIKKFKAEIAAGLATFINAILTLTGHSNFSTLAPAAGFTIAALTCKYCIKKDLYEAKKEHANESNTNKTDLYKTLEAIKESRNPDGTPLFPELLKSIEMKIIALHEDQYIKVSDAADKIKRLEKEDTEISDEIESSVKKTIAGMGQRRI